LDIPFGLFRVLANWIQELEEVLDDLAEIDKRSSGVGVYSAKKKNSQLSR
jgi:hypothetical protein